MIGFLGILLMGMGEFVEGMDFGEMKIQTEF